ncbi:MAG: HU family DNA-binding protein [Oscillospiraceae bacterium]|nr:HU family DNA-binding protein [Oscillospiraceae bacterium]
MTKADLISAVAESTGLTKKDAGKAVAATIDAIADCMKKGDKVSFVGFGTFGTKVRPARVAVNPANGEKIDVPETTVPYFKAGKSLKDLVK